jgi:hypothetical protein
LYTAERALHPREDLDRKFAALQGELYHSPAAKLRADAMLLRDTAAADGNPTGQQWAEIERLLRASWRSLWEVVNAGR